MHINIIFKHVPDMTHFVVVVDDTPKALPLLVDTRLLVGNSDFPCAVDQPLLRFCVVDIGWDEIVRS